MVCYLILQIHFVNVHLAHYIFLKYEYEVYLRCFEVQAPTLALKNNVIWEIKLRAIKIILQIQATACQSYKQGL